MNPNNSINPKNHRKRILLISYYYPPLADTGCRRSVAFAKYFKKYGWEPYVLSVKNPDKTYCSLGNEERPYGINTGYTYSIVNLYKFFGKLNAIFSLIMKIFGIKISRNYFYDLFCIPDIFWGWIPLTTYRGYKLVKKFDIDIIYVSCTPFSGAVIGILLKMMTKKFLIIDFRDPYAFAPESFNYHLRPNFRKKIDAWLENKFVDYADIFLVVTEELRDLYIHHYPKAKDKIFTIYNGIDTEIISRVGSHKKYKKFTITYVGNFYLGSLNSDIFFKAIAFLKEKREIDKDTFQFLFYGGESEKIKNISKDYGIEDLLVAHSKVPYRDVLKVISRSHLLCVRALGAAFPTKIADGLSVNVPLLAIMPPGEAEMIIKRYSPSSYVITEKSVEKINEAILNAIEKYKKGTLQDNLISEFFEKFSREKLTIKLMKIIEENIR